MRKQINSRKGIVVITQPQEHQIGFLPNSGIADGRWHHIQVERTGEDIEIKVDEPLAAFDFSALHLRLDKNIENFKMKLKRAGSQANQARRERGA